MRNFPVDLEIAIISFLDRKDQLEYVLTSRKCSGDLIFGSRQLYLRKIWWKMSSNVERIEKINSLIRCPRNQFYLHFSIYGNYKLPDIEEFADFLHLFQSGAASLHVHLMKMGQFIISIPYIRELAIDMCRDFDVSGNAVYSTSSTEENSLITRIYQYLIEKNSLPSTSKDYLGLETLKLLHNNYIISIPFIQNVKRLVLKLKKLQVLPNAYSSLHSLEIYSCEISDVSAFGSIHHVKFYECMKIIDISGLKYNKIVEVLYCAGIKDYTKSFQDATSISIHQWVRKNQLNFNFLNFDKVKFLKLSGVCVTTPFTDLSNDWLARLHELSLNDGTWTSLPSGFSLIPIIRLSCFRHLQSLEGLGSVGHRNKLVEVRHCPLVLDFTPLNCIPVVSIKSNNAISLHQLSGVEELSLDFSDGKAIEVVDCSGLHFVKRLEIKAYCKIQSLNELKSLQYLKLYYNKCHDYQLPDLNEVGVNVQKVTICIIFGTGVPLCKDEKLGERFEIFYKQNIRGLYSLILLGKKHPDNR